MKVHKIFLFGVFLLGCSLSNSFMMQQKMSKQEIINKLNNINPYTFYFNESMQALDYLEDQGIREALESHVKSLIFVVRLSTKVDWTNWYDFLEKAFEISEKYRTNNEIIGLVNMLYYHISRITNRFSEINELNNLEKWKKWLKYSRISDIRDLIIGSLKDLFGYDYRELEPNVLENFKNSINEYDQIKSPSKFLQIVMPLLKDFIKEQEELNKFSNSNASEVEKIQKKSQMRASANKKYFDLLIMEAQDRINSAIGYKQSNKATRDKNEIMKDIEVNRHDHHKVFPLLLQLTDYVTDPTVLPYLSSWMNSIWTFNRAEIEIAPQIFPFFLAFKIALKEKVNDIKTLQRYKEFESSVIYCEKKFYDHYFQSSVEKLWPFRTNKDYSSNLFWEDISFRFLPYLAYSDVVKIWLLFYLNQIKEQLEKNQLKAQVIRTYWEQFKSYFDIVKQKGLAEKGLDERDLPKIINELDGLIKQKEQQEKLMPKEEKKQESELTSTLEKEEQRRQQEEQKRLQEQELQRQRQLQMEQQERQRQQEDLLRKQEEQRREQELQQQQQREQQRLQAQLQKEQQELLRQQEEQFRLNFIKKQKWNELSQKIEKATNSVTLYHTVYTDLTNNTLFTSEEITKLLNMFKKADIQLLQKASPEKNEDWENTFWQSLKWVNLSLIDQNSIDYNKAYVSFLDKIKKIKDWELNPKIKNEITILFNGFQKFMQQPGKVGPSYNGLVDKIFELYNEMNQYQKKVFLKMIFVPLLQQLGVSAQNCNTAQEKLLKNPSLANFIVAKIVDRTKQKRVQSKEIDPNDFAKVSDSNRNLLFLLRGLGVVEQDYNTVQGKIKENPGLIDENFKNDINNIIVDLIK